MSQDPPRLPLHPAEEAEPDEEASTEAVIADLRRLMARHAAEGRLHRGAHAKAAATVRAELRVPEQDEQPVAQGLFGLPGTYPALVRLSSASEAVQSDRKPDGRGFALKLFGVPGEKYLHDEAPGASLEGADLGCQDLVFTNIPVMPFDSVAEAGAFVRRSLQRVVPLYFASRAGIRRLAALAPATKAHPSLLDLGWNSVTAYQLGEHVVKYHLRLLTELLPPPPAGPDRLRAGLTAQLAQGPVDYELCVQLRVDPERQPVEDTSLVWDPVAFPLLPVARLRLLQQDLTEDAEEREAMGERLRFNPWHARLDMRPLGRLNRARRAIYETLSAERVAD